MRSIKKIATALWASALLGMLTGCGAPTLAHSRYVYNTAITVATNPVTNVNPITETGLSNNLYSQMVYETLVTLNANGTIAPLLAKSWSVSDHDTVYECSLNPYAKWWTGRPVTAANVVWSLTFYRNSANGHFRAHELRDVTSVREISATKVQITLSHSDAGFLSTVLSPRGRLWILPSFLFDRLNPKRVVKSDFLNKIRDAVGNGPYRPIHITKAGMRFEANPHYDLGAPKVKYLRWQWNDSPSTAIRDKNVTLAATAIALSPHLNYGVIRTPADVKWVLIVRSGKTEFIKSIVEQATDFPHLGGISLMSRAPSISLSGTLRRSGYHDVTSKWVSAAGVPLTLSLLTPPSPAAGRLSRRLAAQWRRAGLTVDLSQPTAPLSGNVITLKLVPATAGLDQSNSVPLIRPYEYWYHSRALADFSPNNWVPFAGVQHWRILSSQNRHKTGGKKHP